jgi:small conductance mechanosensitive channel
VLFSVPEEIKKVLDAADIEIPSPHRKIIIAKEE